jgi:hypothetical protein
MSRGGRCSHRSGEEPQPRHAHGTEAGASRDHGQASDDWRTGREGQAPGGALRFMPADAAFLPQSKVLSLSKRLAVPEMARRVGHYRILFASEI